MLVLLAATACHRAMPPRSSPDWVWDEVASCGMAAAAREACAGVGQIGRPLNCQGARPAPVSDKDRDRLKREEDAAYRRGDLACVCITPADWKRCVEVN